MLGADVLEFSFFVLTENHYGPETPGVEKAVNQIYAAKTQTILA